MKSTLKNSEGVFCFFGTQKGSSITMVLFFAVIGMITAFSYLLHQMSFMKPALRSPSSLQALFNARSGIYHAFYKMIDSTIIDTLKTITPLDSSFGASMFGVDDSLIAIPSDKLTLDGIPVPYDLFSDDSLGNCEVSLEPAGGTCLLISTGRFHSIERKVIATLGCRVPALPDTVVMYHNTLEWFGSLPLRGKVVASVDNITINSSWHKSLVDHYLTTIDATDSLLMDPPLLIQNNSDLDKIDSIVNGSLLIDGSSFTIRWNDTGKITIRGDLQISGETVLNGITFIVSGEIKILDESSLVNVNLFSSSRIFIGDEASFNGNAIALHSITIYGKASVIGKSSLIAGSSSGTAFSGTSLSDSLKFSIIIAEESTVDGVCIAIENPGSIKTDSETAISGLLWARNLVCHRGTMKGLIYAYRVVDCDDPLQMTTETSANNAIDSMGHSSQDPTGALVSGKRYNSITGDIEPLPEIASYNLPFFIGRLSITGWREE